MFHRSTSTIVRLDGRRFVSRSHSRGLRHLSSLISSLASDRPCDGGVRYATPGAMPSPLVFRRWNSRKKSLRRSNLQLIDVPHVFRAPTGLAQALQ